MSSAPSPDRHARRREQTRAKLVQAARTLFARQGVDNDVHHAAGVLRLFGLAPEEAAEVPRRPLPSVMAKAGD